MEKKNKIQKIKKENNQLVNQKKLESQLDRLLEGQEINRELIYKGFIGLAQQNQELLESNKKAKKRKFGSKLGQTGNAYPSVIPVVIKPFLPRKERKFFKIDKKIFNLFF
jgi:hypothetical protein